MLTEIITVTKIISAMGVKPSTKGYGYLREAILLTLENPENVQNITKQLYTAIAEKYNDTPPKIERAIRHAIESNWDASAIKWLNNNLVCNFTGKKPSNAEFIATVADSIKVFDEVGKNIFAAVDEANK